jgi:ArsR family transcriptional regulator, arsenate/arsenite/antimonite-responsive transcriptional repressor
MAVSRTRNTGKTRCGSEKAIPLPDDKSAVQFATFARGLAHPARVRIVRLLLDRDTCVCGDIVDHLPLAQSTVSQHLKILKECGLVEGEVDGPRICYCINVDRLKELKKLVAGL